MLMVIFVILMRYNPCLRSKWLRRGRKALCFHYFCFVLILLFVERYVLMQMCFCVRISEKVGRHNLITCFELEKNVGRIH